MYTADAIRDDLMTNMRYTVRWFDALTAMQEMGARVLIEAPPGQVLTDIARENFPEVTALAASSLSFDRLVATARRRLAMGNRVHALVRVASAAPAHRRQTDARLNAFAC